MSELDRHDPITVDDVGVAVAAMPPRRRAIFLAVCGDEASLAEIGQRLGLGAAEVEREFAIALIEAAAALDRHEARLRPLTDRIVRRLTR